MPCRASRGVDFRSFPCLEFCSRSAKLGVVGLCRGPFGIQIVLLPSIGVEGFL